MDPGPGDAPTSLLARPHVALIGAYLLLALYFALFTIVAPPIADCAARVLQRQHADKWLKLISLPLLTLGFLLDLLSP